VKKMITFFRSNALETGLFTMAYSEPAIFNTLVLLASPSHESGKLMSQPITDYVELTEFTDDYVFETSFWALHERIRAKSSGVLIGLHIFADSKTYLAPVLDRRSRLMLTKKDIVIIIAPLRKMPRALAGDLSAPKESAPSADVMATVKLKVSAPIDGCDRVLMKDSLQFPLPSSMSSSATSLLLPAYSASLGALSENVAKTDLSPDSATDPPILPKETREEEAGERPNQQQGLCPPGVMKDGEERADQQPPEE
jgi:hypothetical protein